MSSNEKSRLLNPLEWLEIGLAAGDADAVETWLTRRTDALGFDNVGLVIDIPRSVPAVPAQEQMIGSLVSPAWHDHYRQNEHLLRHDPAAKYLFASETPAFLMLPTHPPSFPIRGPEEAAMMQRVYDFGMRGSFGFSCFDRKNGTISVFSAVTFSSSNTEFVHSSLEHANQIQLACEYLIEGTRAQANGPYAMAKSLSPREHECLLLAAVGKTTKEIADRLSLTDHTVDSYLSAAIRKLGCTTRTQACIRAILLEQITP